MLFIGLILILLSIVALIFIDVKLTVSRKLSIDIPNRKTYQITNKLLDIVYLVATIFCCIYNIFLGISVFFIGIIITFGISSRIVKSIVSKKKLFVKPEKAITGGDGSSITDCVILNCANPKTAYSLIDSFISQRHGKKDIDWKESMKLIKADATGGSNIREIVIELSDGSSTSYFFDVTRSMKFAGMLASMVEKNLSDRE